MSASRGLNLSPAQKSEAPTSHERDSLPVSFVTIEGRTSAHSRFGDPVWYFIGGATNILCSSTRLDFRPVPECFVDDTKKVLYHYVREGRSGRTRPTYSTARSVLMNLRHFMAFLVLRGVPSFSQVTQDDYRAYVNHLRGALTRQGRRISSRSIEKHLLSVELLSEVGAAAGVKVAKPWPDASAAVLSGVPSQAGPRTSKTPVIPEDVLRALFRSAVEVLESASFVLELRDGVAEIKKRTKNSGIYCQNAYLRSRGWNGGVRDLAASLTELRTACYIVIATLSGCRHHEIGHLQNAACFSKREEDGTTTWWFKSKSTKTRIGGCDWMVPRLAIDAIEVMERWARPLQEELENEIKKKRRLGSSDSALAEAIRHRNALFVCRAAGGVRTMASANMRQKLNAFASRRGIVWRLATHQFRRTFAVMAAKSVFGDLRYLKEHFKHWSMDMTLLYAADGFREKELLDEVAEELQDIQLGVTLAWLDPAAKLAGGAASKIKRFREANPVQMYSSRAAMVEMLSGDVHLRSNGHAWCTADDGASCVGATALESTRCVGCANSVIGVEHASFYSHMRNDLEGLLEIEDIGPSGRSRVIRDIARCDSVMKALGLESGE